MNLEQTSHLSGPLKIGDIKNLYHTQNGEKHDFYLLYFDHQKLPSSRAL